MIVAAALRSENPASIRITWDFALETEERPISPSAEKGRGCFRLTAMRLLNLRPCSAFLPADTSASSMATALAISSKIMFLSARPLPQPQAQSKVMPWLS
jgi:hypothetical protein